MLRAVLERSRFQLPRPPFCERLTREGSISTVTAEGEQEGEQGFARGVPPLLHSSPVLIASDAEVAERAGGLFQQQSAPRLSDRGLQAAIFAARTNSIPPARRSMTVPWRERPRDLTAFAITPAATAEVAHATLSLCQPEQAISSMRPAQSAKTRAICTVSSSAVALDCAVRGRTLKALRVAPPAHARGWRPCRIRQNASHVVAA